MSIKINNVGFDTAELNQDAWIGMNLRAEFDSSDSTFEIRDVDNDDELVGYVSEDEAREAAEFFTKLADELKRRAA